MTEYNAGDTIKIKTDTSDRPYITAGKVYTGTVRHGFTERYGYAVLISDDEGDEITILTIGCSYLDDGNWDIVEHEPVTISIRGYEVPLDEVITEVNCVKEQYSPEYKAFTGQIVSSLLDKIVELDNKLKAGV